MQAGGMSLWKQMQRFSEYQAPQTFHEDSSRFVFFTPVQRVYWGSLTMMRGELEARSSLQSLFLIAVLNLPPLLDDHHLRTCWEGTQSLKVLSSPVEYSNLISRSRCPTTPSMVRLVTQGAAVGVLGMIFSRHGPSLVLGYLPRPPPARPNSFPFGDWERGWDGLTALGSLHGFCCFSGLHQ